MTAIQKDKALGYAIEVSRPGESGEFITTRAKRFYEFMAAGSQMEVNAGQFALSRAVSAQMRNVSLSLSTTPGELTEEVLKRARAFLQYFESQG